jgi:hypothetical protein
MNIYHKLLIERILSNEINIENEELIINKLLLLFGPKLTNKSFKVIFDYKKSLENLEIYKKKNNINIFNTITTSYSNWDINYNEGYVTFDSNNNVFLMNLESYIINYIKEYNVIYNNEKKLIWLLQYGEIEINYNGLDIKLLPIQLIVLELYNIKNTFTFDEIINQSFFINYSNKFKENIINSLLNSNILINNNNKIYLNENNNISTNLIDIYINNINNVDNIDKQQFNHIINDLSYDREYIVKTNINHNLKLKSMDKDLLFNKLKNTISVFKLTEEIYNNTINKMIKYDYIMMENNILTKNLY